MKKNILMLCLLTALTIIAAEPLQDQFDKYEQELRSAITEKRPRLFFTAEKFAEMIERAEKEELLKNTMAEVLKRVDLYPTEVNEEIYSQKHGGSVVFYGKDKFGPTAMRAAFCYRMTNDRKYYDLAIRILEYAAEWYNRQYANEQAVSWTAFSRISALCAYDWLYQDMTPDEHQKIGSALLRHVLQAQDTNWIIQSGMQNKGEGTSNWKSSFYGTPLLKFYAGLTFYRASIDDAAAEKLLREGLQDYIRMLNYRAGMAGKTGGGNNSTPGYSFGDAPMCEWLFYYSWQTLTGRNIASDFPGNGLLPHWLFYATFTGIDGKLYEHGTGGSWHMDNKLKMNLRYLAQFRNFFPDSPASKQIEYFISTQDEFRDDAGVFASATWRFNGYFPWLMFKYNYPSQKDIRIDSDFLESFPKAFHFPTLGQTYMSSGRKPDSTYAMFTCGSQSPAHKQMDENHFVIYKGGFLALDSGTRTASGYKDWLDDLWHDNNYYAASIAHNLVTIYMEGEKFGGWPEQKYAVANHGGMYRSTGGIVRAYETNNYYTYIAGDSTACYRPEKCKKNLRQFVFVQPDFFVICDDVESVEPTQTKTWLLHSQNEPQENGDIFHFDEQKGRLFCRTFLPANAKREKIGGPGKEFWVDGKNYPLGKTRLEEYASKNATTLWGNWRMELTHAEPIQSVRFLNLLQVGLSETLAEMVPSEYIKTDTHEGVKFTFKDVQYTVTFRNDGIGGRFCAVRQTETLIDQEFSNEVQKQEAFEHLATKP
jgi:heparin/heparan-sulfate lyase